MIKPQEYVKQICFSLVSLIIKKSISYLDWKDVQCELKNGKVFKENLLAIVDSPQTIKNFSYFKECYQQSQRIKFDPKYLSKDQKCLIQSIDQISQLFKQYFQLNDFTKEKHHIKPLMENNSYRKYENSISSKSQESTSRQQYTDRSKVEY